jgi:hypothetical protein
VGLAITLPPPMFASGDVLWIFAGEMFISSFFCSTGWTRFLTGAGTANSGAERRAALNFWYLQKAACTATAEAPPWNNSKAVLKVATEVETTAQVSKYLRLTR